MRILHLSTSDAGGGAAWAAYRLHTSLRRSGHDSQMLVAQRRSSDPHVVAFRSSRGLGDRLRRRLRRRRIAHCFARYRKSRPQGYDVFGDDRSEHGGGLLTQLPAADVINLHWVTGLMDFETFFPTVPRRTPVVWTLHDMNAFTGGCHFDDGCGKFTAACGCCPQLGSKDQRDLSHSVWVRKERSLRRMESHHLHVATPSRWLAHEVEHSSLLGGHFSVRVLPNGIDTEAFHPRDRSAVRSTLGMPQDARVVLFMSAALDNRRKGFAFLAQALTGLDVPNLLLLSLGRGVPALGPDVAHMPFGFVESERLLSVIYSAADLYVIPSLQDNLPNGVLEAMAHGVPVVGFDVGGIPDMVRPGLTGRLVPCGDVDTLRSAMTELLMDDGLRRKMSENCRRSTVNEYALEVHAQQYLDLYSQVIEGHARAAGKSRA